jgi:hypothetical protein
VGVASFRSDDVSLSVRNVAGNDVILFSPLGGAASDFLYEFGKNDGNFV